MTRLAVRAWFALVVLAVVMGLLLFIAAGTTSYWQAWVYLGIFFGASALTTVFLIRRDPALLERRMRGGPTAEKRPVERRQDRQEAAAGRHGERLPEELRRRS